MIGRDERLDEEGERAPQVVVRDQRAARLAVRILREELQTARGPGRQALVFTIEMRERLGMASAFRPGMRVRNWRSHEIRWRPLTGSQGTPIAGMS
jgi:hypothetical protein